MLSKFPSSSLSPFCLLLFLSPLLIIKCGLEVQIRKKSCHLDAFVIASSSSSFSVVFLPSQFITTGTVDNIEIRDFCHFDIWLIRRLTISSNTIQDAWLMLPLGFKQYFSQLLRAAYMQTAVSSSTIQIDAWLIILVGLKQYFIQLLSVV